MKVKNLIRNLKKWNPNAEVRIGRYGGPVDLCVKGLSVYILSPSDIQDYVYIGCDVIESELEKVTQTNPVANTIIPSERQIPAYSFSQLEN